MPLPLCLYSPLTQTLYIMSTVFDKQINNDTLYNNVVKQYEGTGYEDAAKANPYLTSTYKTSAWENIARALGFRTGFDKYETDRMSKAYEYSAQLTNQMREEEYNSEASQVARQRAAGINPDLNGITSSQASESTELGAVDSPAPSESLGQMQGFIMTALNFGLQFATGLQTINGQILTNEGKAIANISSIRDQAYQGWDNFIGELDPQDVFDRSKYWNNVTRAIGFDPETGELLSGAAHYGNPYKIGSKNYDTFNSLQDQYMRNHPEVARKYFDNKSKLLSSAGEYGKGLGAGGSDTDGFNEFVKCFKALGKAQMDADTAVAESTEAQADDTKQTAQMHKALRNPVSEVVSALSDFAQDDKQSEFWRMIANGMLMFLYMAPNMGNMFK